MTLRSTGQIGHDIRPPPKPGLTLIDLANELDRSVGWLSQVERVGRQSRPYQTFAKWPCFLICR